MHRELNSSCRLSCLSLSLLLSSWALPLFLMILILCACHETAPILSVCLYMLQWFGRLQYCRSYTCFEVIDHVLQLTSPRPNPFVHFAAWGTAATG